MNGQCVGSMLDGAVGELHGPVAPRLAPSSGRQPGTNAGLADHNNPPLLRTRRQQLVSDYLQWLTAGLDIVGRPVKLHEQQHGRSLGTAVDRMGGEAAEAWIREGGAILTQWTGRPAVQRPRRSNTWHANS